MKKNNYYLYTNIDELYGFLVNNAIYPSAKENSALSLAKTGYIYLTKKHFSKDYIYNKCQMGIMSPVVLEVSIKTSHDKSIININDTDILVSSIISFNSVVSIYYLDGELPLSLFNDAYLFRSLLSDKDFEYGEDKQIDMDSIKNADVDLSLSNKWDKIQGFFACYYGSVHSEFRAGKRVMIASNLDDDFALELLGESQNDFLRHEFPSFNKYYFEEKNSLSSEVSQILNTNIDNLLKGKKIKGKHQNNDFISNLFQSSILYKNGDELINSFYPIIREEMLKISQIYQDNIFSLKESLFKEGNDLLRFAYLLSTIIKKEFEEAADYLSNFENLSGIEKKCLFGLYGLCVGLSHLTLSIKKKRPDLLLFAFNRAKKYFANYVDSAVSVFNYFLYRDFITDHVIKDGFNYVAYNYLYELHYVKATLANKLISDFNIPIGMLSKDLIKFTTPEELHKTYLLVKGGN